MTHESMKSINCIRLLFEKIDNRNVWVFVGIFLREDGWLFWFWFWTWTWVPFPEIKTRCLFLLIWGWLKFLSCDLWLPKSSVFWLNWKSLEIFLDSESFSSGQRPLLLLDNMWFPSVETLLEFSVFSVCSVFSDTIGLPSFRLTDAFMNTFSSVPFWSGNISVMCPEPFRNMSSLYWFGFLNRLFSFGLFPFGLFPFGLFLFWLFLFVLLVF